MRRIDWVGAIAATCLSTTVVAAAHAEPAQSTGAKCVVKVVTENEKYLVQDTQCAPGASSPMTKRPMRVVYTIKGATLKRTYDDGSTETVVLADGQTVILNINRAYSFKNESDVAYHALSVTTK